MQCSELFLDATHIVAAAAEITAQMTPYQLPLSATYDSTHPPKPADVFAFTSRNQLDKLLIRFGSNSPADIQGIAIQGTNLVAVHGSFSPTIPLDSICGQGGLGELNPPNGPGFVHGPDASARCYKSFESDQAISIIVGQTQYHARMIGDANNGVLEVIDENGRPVIFSPDNPESVRMLRDIISRMVIAATTLNFSQTHESRQFSFFSTIATLPPDLLSTFEQTQITPPPQFIEPKQPSPPPTENITPTITPGPEKPTYSNDLSIAPTYASTFYF